MMTRWKKVAGNKIASNTCHNRPTLNFMKEIPIVSTTNQASRQAINQAAKKVQETEHHQRNNFQDQRMSSAVKLIAVLVKK